MSSDTEFFTIVFVGDIAELPWNPFAVTVSPFGQPVVVARGNTLAAGDAAESHRLLPPQARPMVFADAERANTARRIAEVIRSYPNLDIIGLRSGPDTNAIGIAAAGDLLAVLDHVAGLVEGGAT